MATEIERRFQQAAFRSSATDLPVTTPLLLRALWVLLLLLALGGRDRSLPPAAAAPRVDSVGTACP